MTCHRSQFRQKATSPLYDQLARLDVAIELLRPCKHLQFPQTLVLYLADPLARDVERPPDLVQRARIPTVEAVAELQHCSVAAGQRTEDFPQRFLAKRRLRRLVRQLLVLVCEEITELRVLLVTDRLLERDRGLGAAPDRLDLGGVELELVADLPGERLAPKLGAELPLRSYDLVQLLDDVDRHPDRPRLVGERPGGGLADPPGRVGRELEAFAVVELLGRTDEADRPFLDQVEERQPLVPILLGDRDHEAQVCLDHLLLRAMVAALDPLGELDLLCRGEQVDLADVLEKELQRVGRDLARLFERRRVFRDGIADHRYVRSRGHSLPILDSGPPIANDHLGRMRTVLRNGPSRQEERGRRCSLELRENASTSRCENASTS